MAATLKLAVFGDPVEHSLSPQIHTLFAHQFNLDIDYQRIRSDIKQLAEKIEQFAGAGGRGANLTVPLKEAGRRQCRHVDQPARLARAVNTLNLKADGWHGHNTDGPGLLLDFARLDLATTGTRILIVGAGGATAGILGPLLARTPTEICLLNRTEARAIELAERFSHLGPTTAVPLDQGPTKGGFDLLIQATSSGHHNTLPPLNPDWLHPDARVYDLNYGPAHQPLARWCQAHEFECHDGLGMLVGQAALAFKIWTGQAPDIEQALQELRRQQST